MYSLPQDLELKKDNWQLFLPNNYKDMPSTVTSIKPVNKTGALIMMKNESPIQFMGVDQLQTDAGTKVTIGDGGLFNQALQNLTNADKSYQYGSCQNKYSVINTPYGLFYLSQEQGKVFNFTDQLDEISRMGNKWWFANYLPSYLLKQFPEYKLFDNPIVGIGCMAIYDNTNDMVYFTKRDYKPNSDKIIKLDEDGVRFYTEIGVPGNTIRRYIQLSNTEFFTEAHFTISYDPKNKQWISFHDWHPNFLLPGKNHFMSVVNNQIWKHNQRCDSFCNFYGTNFPFEVEFVSSTGQQVNSLRSVEYILESYEYESNCTDKYHTLDNNFDNAIVYNSEQISGVLNLNITPKNNPRAILNFPAITGSGIDILYSKEENKYRFNQFWDITRDRGEFVANPQNMFVTNPNGYVFTINPNYINLNKDTFQRKKFRHNNNKIFLRKSISGNQKLIFKMINLKNLYSPR
jgi:hypothetical protein